MPDEKELTAWSALSPERQLRLAVAFGHAADRHPEMRVCDLAEKNRLFAEFLAEHGVRWCGRE
jgi:hypothetical protein